MPATSATYVFNSLVQDLSFKGNALGTVGQTVFGLIRLRYWIWYCSARKKEVMNSNATELTLGIVLNFTVSNDKVRTGARLLLLITRIERCVKQIKLLLADCNNFRDVLRGKISTNTHVRWIPSRNGAPINIYYSSRKTYQNSLHYVVEVSLRLWAVLKRLDKLLMCAIDAHEALLADNEAMIMSMQNSSKMIKRILENRDLLCKALEDRKPMIEKCLSFFAQGDAKENTETLLTDIKATLDKGQKMYATYEKAISPSNEMIKDFGKRAAFGVYHVIGLARFMPDYLRPEPEHVVRARIFKDPAFPPIQDVRDRKWRAIENGSR